MKQNKIILFGYHSSAKQRQERNVSLAAAAKTDYLIKLLQENDYEIVVLSLAQKKDINYRAKNEFTEKNSDVTYIYPPQHIKKSLFGKIINKLMISKWLRKKIKSVFPNNIVLCYHSIYLIDSLIQAKKSKQFTLILEVEEIYSSLDKYKKYKKKEFKIFNKADKFLTITESVNNLINISQKKHINYYGPYDKYIPFGSRRTDDRTHVVYSGTIEEEKGGFLLSLEVFKKLPKNYVGHILISQSDNKSHSYAIKKIEEVNNQSNKNIVFHGTKYGEEFLSLLSTFDIGLAIQNNDDKFSVASFPSKTLTYLKCGLTVLVTNSKSFDNSPFIDIFNFTNTNSVDEIVQMIVNIEKDKLKNNDFIDKLNKDFSKQFISFLED